MNEPKDRITIKEAATILECTEQAVRCLIKAGRLPGAYIGTDLRSEYYIYRPAMENFKNGFLWANTRNSKTEDIPS